MATIQGTKRQQFKEQKDNNSRNKKTTIAPSIWDSIRYKVDHADSLGCYILTGSAVPADVSELRHSGTGRFS